MVFINARELESLTFNKGIAPMELEEEGAVSFGVTKMPPLLGL